MGGLYFDLDQSEGLRLPPSKKAARASPGQIITCAYSHRDSLQLIGRLFLVLVAADSDGDFSRALIEQAFCVSGLAEVGASLSCHRCGE